MLTNTQSNAHAVMLNNVKKMRKTLTC